MKKRQKTQRLKSKYIYWENDTNTSDADEISIRSDLDNESVDEIKKESESDNNNDPEIMNKIDKGAGF